MNRRVLGLVAAGSLAVSCLLPDVEFDANAGKAAAGRGGASGSGGAGGKGGGAGKAGSGGSGGEGGVDLGTLTELRCGTYCDLYFTACREHEANTYDDKDDCFLTCVTSDWPLEDPDRINAPTIACRVHHAGLANTQGTDPHCFHSAEVPSKGACDGP